MSLTGARELAVLSIVVAHPVHGYQIASAFEKGPMQLLGLKRSAVYSILSRFVARGWIEEREEPGSAYPDRRVCHPTEAGRAALEGLLAKAGGLAQSPLMAILMMQDMGAEVSIALEEQRALRVALLTGLSAADPDHAHSLAARLAAQTLSAEIEVIDAALGAKSS